MNSISRIGVMVPPAGSSSSKVKAPLMLTCTRSSVPSAGSNAGTPTTGTRPLTIEKLDVRTSGIACATGTADNSTVAARPTAATND
jgi:hypothetical protein